MGDSISRHEAFMRVVRMSEDGGMEMSVMINGIDMPKNRDECPVKSWTDDGYVCPFSGILTLCIGIQADCPLVEVTSEELKTGRWFVLDECANEGVYCSECGKKVFKHDFSNTMKWKNFKYCPNCGKKMEMKGESND